MADETTTNTVVPVTTTGDTAPMAAATTPDVRETAAPKGPACPKCKAPLDVYGGDNPHKLRTGFCHACGERHRLKR